MNDQDFISAAEFFTSFGRTYVENLKKKGIDFTRMKVDKQYAKKSFLTYWGYERADVPYGYKVAAIKAINDSSTSNLRDVYKKYYPSKYNEMNNPMLDKRIKDLDVCKVIQLIDEGRLTNAFDSLSIRGISHKIRSFFIRDMAYLFGWVRPVNLKINKQKVERPTASQEYLYMFPMDFWVRSVLTHLIPIIDKQQNFRNYGAYHKMEYRDRITAINFINKYADLGLNKNPKNLLLANMGMYMFGAKVVAHSERLNELMTPNLKEGKLGKRLETEVDLLEGYYNL